MLNKKQGSNCFSWNNNFKKELREELRATNIQGIVMVTDIIWKVVGQRETLERDSLK